MTWIGASERTATRRHRRLLAAGLIAVTALITAALIRPVPRLASSAASLPASSPSPLSPGESGESPVAGPPVAHRRAAPQRTTGEAGGMLPDDVTVFDEEYPGVTKLDPDLLQALRAAATEAATHDGVKLFLNSGWRSPEHQNQLLRQAIAKYGSRAEAARWVATADTSPHVSGDAVDIGGAHATAWLSAHGAGYGLCQIYRNEPWHYELRTGAVDHGCPRRYADPTQDPRMQR